jgi:hypothetical protein
MQRSERLTAVVGAVLVAGTALAAVAMLTTHGAASAEPVAADDDGLLSMDLSWAWFETCRAETTQSTGFSYGIDRNDAGFMTATITDSIDPQVDEAELTAHEEELNACLATRRFAPGQVDIAQWSEREPAGRLLLHDVHARWVHPCLLAWGLHPSAPDLSEYVNTDRMPWAYIYDMMIYGTDGSMAPFDDIVEARRACGVPSDVFTPAGAG